MKRLLLASTFAVMGCGSVVIEPSDTGTTTAGAGGSSVTGTTGTTTGTTGTTGTMTGSTGTTTGTTGTTTGTTTSTALPSCEDDPSLYFTTSIDGVLYEFGPECHPRGYLQHGGGGPPPPPPGPPEPISGTLVFDACTLMALSGVNIYAASSAWPGVSDTANFSAFTQVPPLYAPDGATVVQVSSIGPVGATIEGSFKSMVSSTPGSPTLPVDGTFRVCRTPDIDPP